MLTISTRVAQASGLARVEELYKNRTERAQELRKEGKKVIGYICCFPPVEMFTALDMVPYRIMGSVQEPITQANAYLETIMCPFVRSCFDLARKGNYDFLDGLVMPHSCDTIVKVYDIWRYYQPYPFTHFINVPHMVHQSSFKFFKIELQGLRKALEKFAGAELSDDKLRRAIKLHNEHRALLRQLYDLRKPDPPLLSGAEVTKILVAGMTIPVQEGNELLRQVIVEVNRRREGRPEKKTARVLVYGAEIDDMAFIKLVEECGANVVMDDLCTGTRHFWHDVPLTADPLDGIVKRYLESIPCPRTYREPPGGHEADLENRFGYLKQFAQDFKVNAAILYIIRYCDTHELDMPDVRDYLQGLGYPVLHLEDDYNLTTIGQLRTRIQAFLEMIG